jgi:mRNA-degrading endonuclease toxin of MazEF toxin-antitoxin module
VIRRGNLGLLGSEVGKTHPAIVLQNDLANRSSPTVTVIHLWF